MWLPARWEGPLRTIVQWKSVSCQHWWYLFSAFVWRTILRMYPYTRSTWSQTLRVVQHTVFDVQASKHLFHTYNTVVLFNIIINYYYCCGRVWPCCCRLISVDTYATCHMHALSTLELRGGPEHARAIWFTLTSPFVKRLWKLVKQITN